MDTMPISYIVEECPLSILDSLHAIVIGGPMESGQCPKCSSTNVYVQQNEPAVITINGRRCDHDDYICTDCGYFETYITDPKALSGVVENWKRVNPY